MIIKRGLAFLLGVALCASITLGQSIVPIRTLVYAPTITITTGPANSTWITSTSATKANVIMTFGTVVGSYTGCVVQAVTDYDGNTNNALLLGSATSITVASNTKQAWTINAGSGTSASSTVAQSFGIDFQLQFSCGGYGTSLPATLSVMFPGNGGVGGSGGGGGGAATIADGADTAEGATTDAASSAGGVGTVSAKLREITSELNSILSSPGLPSNAALETGGNLAATAGGVGATGDAAAAAGGTGSLSAKLREITSELSNIALESGGNLAATANGIGTTGDAASSAGGTGTLSAKLREITAELNSIATSPALPTNAALENGGNLASAAGGIGATGDAAAAAGGTGSLSAKLREITAQLNAVLHVSVDAITATPTGQTNAAGASSVVPCNTAITCTFSAALINQSTLPTYSASKVGLVPASSPTDIAVLSGNGTNTVIVNRIVLSCTQTTAGAIDIRLLKRTTADSGGTSTGSPSAYALDSNDSAATSAVLTYTANPTVNDGTDRVIDSGKIAALAPATASANDIYIWTAPVGSKALVLRGTAQQAAVNLNGVTLTGGSCDVSFIWTETTAL